MGFAGKRLMNHCNIVNFGEVMYIMWIFLGKEVPRIHQFQRAWKPKKLRTKKKKKLRTTAKMSLYPPLYLIISNFVLQLPYPLNKSYFR